jgi:hypothetical protein
MKKEEEEKRKLKERNWVFWKEKATKEKLVSEENLIENPK